MLQVATGVQALQRPPRLRLLARGYGPKTGVGARALVMAHYRIHPALMALMGIVAKDKANAELRKKAKGLK
jgi:hypothetical protein